MNSANNFDCSFDCANFKLGKLKVNNHSIALFKPIINNF